MREWTKWGSRGSLRTSGTRTGENILDMTMVEFPRAASTRVVTDRESVKTELYIVANVCRHTSSVVSQHVIPYVPTYKERHR